ncbi:FG-GAP-like repeat-containing protein [Trichlorobacter ammonificans]|uniref:Peptidase_S8 domain-containing protein n=1 Tax=Trichlorobacter ammonificans TaxID=2916410 RepID=A0ABN8HB97_9BACT|nr:FG-GAP-like repeat-containing protein [Trichlorobacter ammonificans]CAH2029942.1 Peptidase_S8 domain-containing protein [Trichlorobacter ammonificans]
MSYNIRKAMALLSLLAVMTACGDTQQQALLPNGSAAESAFTQKSSDTADSSMAISTEDAAVSLNATPDGLPVPPQVAEKLYGIAQTTGAVRVIVGFNAPPELPDGFMAEGTLGGGYKKNPAANQNAIAAQRASIQRIQDRILDRVSFKNKAKSKKFSSIPYMALEVDTADFQALLASPEVTHIQEDIAVPPMLTESVPLIGGSGGSFSGQSGSGQTVAILDTGVATGHPVFSGKIVSEACYSTAMSGQSTSVCPNGQNSQTGSGAGINCNTAITGCDHGTHVAAIAAGTTGVAKDAKIIAIQVFSNHSGRALSWSSDQIAALERVYALRSDYNIASVNMSLGGGGPYASSCDAGNAAFKAAVDNLRSVGIATVIASGNDGFTTGISSPACVSTAIAVGSTSKQNTVASYSNSSSLIKLLAPGSSIYAAVPGNTYAYKSGTSMATPHVAGAWAVMKSKKPTATVDEVLNTLIGTGVSIRDTRNNVTKPRIKLDTAVSQLVDVTPYIGDGKADILWRNPTTGQNSIWFMDTDGSRLASAALTTVAPPWAIASISDFNGDGKPDILWRNPTTGQNSVWIMDGTTRTGSVALTTVVSPWTIASVSDFNGDGKLDILWRNPTTGQNSVWIMDGTTRTGSVALTTVVSPWTIASVSDLNGDGKPDILWRNPSTGQNSAWIMDGTTRTSSVALTTVAAPWTIASVSGLNGDGKPDILWRNPSTGQNSVWIMDGTTRTSSVALTTVAAPWTIVAVADLNGDGKPDILWRNPSTGQNSVWIMDGTTRTSSVALTTVAAPWKIVGTSN